MWSLWSIAQIPTVQQPSIQVMFRNPANPQRWELGKPHNFYSTQIVDSQPQIQTMTAKNKHILGTSLTILEMNQCPYPLIIKHGWLENPPIIHSLWCMVGGWALPLWKIWNSVGMMTFPTEWKDKTCSKPPTSYVLLHLNVQFAWGFPR